MQVMPGLIPSAGMHSVQTSHPLYCTSLNQSAMHAFKSPKNFIGDSFGWHYELPACLIFSQIHVAEPLQKWAGF